MFSHETVVVLRYVKYSQVIYSVCQLY